MERSLFRYILKRSAKAQLLIALLTALSLPFYYVSLEMPKLIVNKALTADSGAFPQAFGLFGRELLQLEQISWLALLCGVFLIAVLVTGALKYRLNVYKGLLGERLLRGLRLELCARMLRFPLAHFRRLSAGELSTMITAEVEPLAGFIGDAFAVPLLQGGILLTAMVFIFLQNSLLGLAAVALFPVQAYLIPRLRLQVLELGRERVVEVRRLSTRIGDAVAMAREIRVDGAGAYELSVLDRSLARLLDIRYRLFRRKFFVKFLNNFLFQLTPFLFLLIGGYLVIKGELTIGALVAVLAAYKDLPPPGRELLDYYQTYLDVHIKYEQVAGQFAPLGMLPAEVLSAAAPPPEVLSGALTVEGLVLEDGGVRLLDEVSFTVGPEEHVAIVGASQHGAEALARSLLRLERPLAGTITIGDRKLDDIPYGVLAGALAYVDSDPAFVTGTIEENLHYARAPHEPTQERTEQLQLLRLTEMYDELYALGLHTIVDPRRYPDLARRVVEARYALHERLARGRSGTLLDPFDRNRYCVHASVAENLLFGRPLSPAFAFDRLLEQRSVYVVLRRARLVPELLRVGRAAVAAVLEAQAAAVVLPADDQGRSLIAADELPELRSLSERAQGDAGLLSTAERRRLLAIALRVIASRHPFGAIDESLQARLVQARGQLFATMPAALRAQIAFFEPSRYNPALTIQDNLLFGRVAEERAHALRAIGLAISIVADGFDLRGAISEAASDYPVGVGGGGLSPAQRQKLSLARALLKGPQILIGCRATNKLDSPVEARVLHKMLGYLRGRCVLWACDDPGLARAFDRVLLFEDGRLLAQGGYEELGLGAPHVAARLAESRSSPPPPGS